MITYNLNLANHEYITLIRLKYHTKNVINNLENKMIGY